MTIEDFWFDYFARFFDQVQEGLSVVLNANGCREGWLQGELYRTSREQRITVNSYSLGGSLKADVHCPNEPAMIAEIKIIGGDYSPKQQYALEVDVQRLREVADTKLLRYMILVVPHYGEDSTLGRYLQEVEFSEKRVSRNYEAFQLRIWKL